ncbi:hypothetical protein Tsubulata_004551 [Turnera subulata]|uniref:NAC domain-containing protein n=1 Tax=Turnera subulata TaxID=218843 RepID=A0A9Q0FTH6_9ROSI|nr:hypothetical protein Tsubulata_004551 [Turnera subulata]
MQGDGQFMHANATNGLPPGFRFAPTDEDLVGCYLSRKVTYQNSSAFDSQPVIPECDIYGEEQPWHIFQRLGLNIHNDLHLFTKLKRMAKGSRFNRKIGLTGAGWHGVDSGTPVVVGGLEATRKRFSYWKTDKKQGKHDCVGQECCWTMIEYSVDSPSPSDWTLCIVRNNCSVVKESNDLGTSTTSEKKRCAGETRKKFSRKRKLDDASSESKVISSRKRKLDNASSESDHIICASETASEPATEPVLQVESFSLDDFSDADFWETNPAADDVSNDFLADISSFDPEACIWKMADRKANPDFEQAPPDNIQASQSGPVTNEGEEKDVNVYPMSADLQSLCNGEKGDCNSHSYDWHVCSTDGDFWETNPTDDVSNDFLADISSSDPEAYLWEMADKKANPDFEQAPAEIPSTPVSLLTPIQASESESAGPDTNEAEEKDANDDQMYGDLQSLCSGEKGHGNSSHSYGCHVDFFSNMLFKDIGGHGWHVASY